MHAAKRLLLIIGGGIAAYKCLDLIRELRRQNIAVRIVLTRAAKEFVTPSSVASLSGEQVFDELFSLKEETEIGHIRLSREADLVMVCPATADLIGKTANGLADDLASTLLLATDKPVLWAPSMNVRMFEHPAVQENIAQLRRRGALFIGPEEGEMACGEFGPGRLAAQEILIDAIHCALKQGNARTIQTPLAGLTAVVTAGPTHEPVDPVRYLANRSSGKQGYHIAAALRDLGAQVTLVSGPTAVADPAGMKIVHVETAQQMLAAVEANLPADLFVSVAAVADFRPASSNKQKIRKKEGEKHAQLKLALNPDILAKISRRKKNRPELVVGFAAETQKLLEHAREKRKRKGCDWIIANDVNGGVMGGDHNQAILIMENEELALSGKTKFEIAKALARQVAQFFTSAAKD